MPDKMRIEVAPNQQVTALIYTAGKPNLAGVTVILGHGAGAGQTSDFMTRFATGLAARGFPPPSIRWSPVRKPNTAEELRCAVAVSSPNVTAGVGHET